MVNKRSFYSTTREELANLFKSEGLNSFSATQIFEWVYKRKETKLDNWSNVSKKVRDFFDANFSMDLPTIVFHGVSEDGTVKFLIQFSDRKQVESVLIPAPKRLTLCVSSQVGCALGCTFCHTGTQGLTRHLKSSEVIGQLLVLQNWIEMNHDKCEKLLKIVNQQEEDDDEDDEIAQTPEMENLKTNGLKKKGITNIVFMGQGEPLHNFENIKNAVKILTDSKGLDWGPRKITLSTAGMIPQLKRWSELEPISLAISLHSLDENIRSELMPVNRAFSLSELLEVLDSIPLGGRKKITYEYLLLDGVNNRKEDIKLISQKLNPSRAKLNLIPFNEYPGSHFKRPSEENIAWFRNNLKERGFVCTVRISKGRDIYAACGQLNTKKSQTVASPSLSL